MQLQCPNCHSADDISEWDDGYLCCECGTEFDGPYMPDETDEDEEDETAPKAHAHHRD
jgi:DNA-directed RNA polymerase subunit RPC12/RpoP